MSNRVVKTAIFRKSVTMTAIGSGGTAFTFANVISGLWRVRSVTVSRISGANVTAVGVLFGLDGGVTLSQPQGGVAVQTIASSGRTAWTAVDEQWLIPGTSTGTGTAHLVGNGSTGDVFEVEIVAELLESGEVTAGWTEYL